MKPSEPSLIYANVSLSEAVLAQDEWRATGTVRASYLDAFSEEFSNEAAPGGFSVLRHFLRQVTAIEKVVAVIAERGEEAAEVQVTTITTSMDDDIRSAIYAAERNLIDTAPMLRFNFHAHKRVSEPSGAVIVPTADRPLLVWRRRSADGR